MAYDLYYSRRNYRDGSGMPRFRGDVAVQNGRIAVVGKVSGGATRILDADGLVVAPGVIDNHCHYDAQLTWDPLADFLLLPRCDDGSHRQSLAGPRSCSRLRLVPLGKPSFAGRGHSSGSPRCRRCVVLETLPQYFDALDRRLGVNVASFIGHSAVRRYVMGDAAYEREATEDEVGEMRGIVREGMEAGALGISFDDVRHFDHEGRIAPTYMAADAERYAVAGVLDEVGRGTIQVGGDRAGNSAGEGRWMSRSMEHQPERRLFGWMETYAAGGRRAGSKACARTVSRSNPARTFAIPSNAQH